MAADTDDDSYRPSKRSRADLRPPPAARNHDDADGTQSSPGRSKRGHGHSREDFPATDQTDDEPFEVSTQNQPNPEVSEAPYRLPLNPLILVVPVLG